MSGTDTPAITIPNPRLSVPSASPIESPGTPSRPSKIEPWHLQRLAVVYVRQSSPQQVINNKESAEVQANLRNSAVAWGWPPTRVIVVNEDQALSGTSTEGRTGFQWLLTEVNLDHVGIILGFQVSRLSRANSDWYRLLERCAVFHTLLADHDGIYDPVLYNDRLLLGLKGTMSEAELHFMRQRLYQGLLNKARRGEQFTSAPIGYVRSFSGNRLELDPDEQVQHVVRLIFDKFDELESVGALLRYLVRNGIKLGFRERGGPDVGQLRWRPAARPTLLKILRHPYYAGCYVFGFTRRDPRRRASGHPRSGTVHVERLKWDVIIPDALLAYITWDRYLANQQRLTANRCLPTTPGAPRGGQSLLSGLVFCGRCGQKMRINYHADDEPFYYLCNFRYVAHAEPLCQSLAGKPLEELVTAELLEAIKPAGLELSIQAAADLRCERQRLDRHWQLRLERARLEADRAARQYHAVEPENRLVARQLERRWEQAMQDQWELQEQYDRFLAASPRELTAQDLQTIRALAADVPGLWYGPGTTVQERQRIVRCLVERVTVAVRGQSEWVDVVIRWVGGHDSRHEVRRDVRRYDHLSNYALLRDRMIELRRCGATAEEIAERLNHEGFHPPRGSDGFNRQRVSQFLYRLGVLSPEANRRVNPEDLRPDEWRLADLAGELGMPAITLQHWCYRGWVRTRKSSEVRGTWIFWADQADLSRLRRLREWNLTSHDCPRPAELTIPGVPKPPLPQPETRTPPRGRRGSKSREEGL